MINTYVGTAPITSTIHARCCSMYGCFVTRPATYLPFAVPSPLQSSRPPATQLFTPFGCIYGQDTIILEAPHPLPPPSITSVRQVVNSLAVSQSDTHAEVASPSAVRAAGFRMSACCVAHLKVPASQNTPVTTTVNVWCSMRVGGHGCMHAWLHALYAVYMTHEIKCPTHRTAEEEARVDLGLFLRCSPTLLE